MFKNCILALSLFSLLTAPVSANSVVDQYGVTWSVSAEWNEDSAGLDIRLSNNSPEDPNIQFLLTDSDDDTQPYIFLYPDGSTIGIVWIHYDQAKAASEVHRADYDPENYQLENAVLLSSEACLAFYSYPKVMVSRTGEMYLLYRKTCVKTGQNYSLLLQRELFMDGLFSDPVVISKPNENVVDLVLGEPGPTNDPSALLKYSYEQTILGKARTRYIKVLYKRDGGDPDPWFVVDEYSLTGY